MSAPSEAAGEPPRRCEGGLIAVDDDIARSDHKSQHSQRWLERPKVSWIVTAAAIPVAAAASSRDGSWVRAAGS
jgi:hypothetical protein